MAEFVYGYQRISIKDYYLQSQITVMLENWYRVSIHKVIMSDWIKI